MGVIVNKDNSLENDLTRRIDADLREKMSKASKVEEDVDLAEETDYVKDLKKTSKYSWVWILLVVFVLILLVAVGMSFKNN
ncbi:hypothetical protein IJU85_01305 [Candidatus Saccharibacteria bacterium]|nr:hypothetical protein [Candidatus Saccharibacteria bacterium]